MNPGNNVDTWLAGRALADQTLKQWSVTARNQPRKASRCSVLRDRETGPNQAGSLPFRDSVAASRGG